MKIFKSNHIVAIVFFTLSFAMCISCKKLVEIDPPRNEMVTESVFTNDASAEAAIRGIYSLMATDGNFSNADLELYTGLSSDELDYYASNAEYNQFYANNLRSNNSLVQNIFWSKAYSYIYNANGILEGIVASTGMSDGKKLQLEGEAKFVRAFCYFYLVNFFGDVPYINTTDYRVAAASTRMAKAQVYSKIVTDLLDAQRLLKTDYSVSMGQRTRPNSFAATALLARVYLYTGKWTEAEMQATSLIDNTADFILENNLLDVFLATSREAIWQLKEDAPGSGPTYADRFVLTDGSFASVHFAITSELLGAFELTDQRKADWVGNLSNSNGSWNFSNKYKDKFGALQNESYAFFRLAEQYLIRAEARTQLGRFAGINSAQSDLNAVRNRAGLGDTDATDKPTMMAAIEKERRIELFVEGGHRWLDLIRWGRVDAVIGGVKAGWKSSDALYPIPASEILAAPQLTQNPNY